MRLSKIKLAGFKSFVDPATVHFPSNLVGVVGPNGCGKSNVIDAVRWVMGESSAKHLRGGSMEDVIFNGSSQRKPVGQASVELIFDNSDGSLGGEYAQYNEISVKRSVSREGSSSYYLNSTRCRRRDITDIFLGTGLGPRSYAIIEQGMISRLIEAKPEDLRVYLEEAAGISKYKERRRETENRIRHTRENLERLNDLREEVVKHLEHLARQKRTAEKYRELKAEERDGHAGLLALRWRDMAAELEERERRLAAERTQLEEVVAEQRRAESDIEGAREQQHEASDAFNGVQGRYYRIGAEISSTEQQIQHNKDARQRGRDELEQVEREYRETEEQVRADRERLETLDATLAADRPEHERLKASQDESAAVLETAESAMQEWQAEWEDFNRRATEPAQTAQVERSRMEQLERHVEQANQRLQRVEQEAGQFDPEGLDGEIETLTAEEAQAQAETTRLQGTLTDNGEALEQARSEQAEARRTLETARGEQQDLSGRVTSLQALQQAALGESDEHVVDWLGQQGIAEHPRLAQALSVESGWERAVEVVLGPFLEAVCLEGHDGLEPAAGAVSQLEAGAVSLVDGAAIEALAADGSADDGSADDGSAESLLDRVDATPPLAGLLAGVRTAPDLDTALRQRRELPAGTSVVTPEGVWLGVNWLRFARPSADDAGVLRREQELAVARESLDRLRQQVSEHEAEVERLAQSVAELEEQREQAQQALNEAHRQHADIGSRLEGRRMRLEQVRQRRDQLAEEARELREQIERETAEMREAETARNRALEQSEAFDSERGDLQQRRERLASELEQARERARADRDAGHEVALRVESTRSSRDATAENLERMQTRLTQLEQRRSDLQAQLEGSDEPIRALETELNEKLSSRVEIEQEMAAARQRVEEVEQRIRELEQQRGDCERRAGEIRERVGTEQMAVQETRVRRETVEEQLTEIDQAVQPLLESLPEDADTEAWQAYVEQLGRRIERLGPVNLAAIDEFDEQTQRKEYLDQQHTDVTQALETLENAIARIDRETRQRFKMTFDTVNQQLQALFPRLFGGGQAHLEMTGDDLLSTGVSIMARPPGKRVSNIHLLSGGEKALTAVALVFAFFELNPAPFCMLDEVDAPLDDANVGRYCDLVREMSERVQFIFITHNKQTMELTNQLTGVTMREAGVSRLVSVDVHEAAEFAEA